MQTKSFQIRELLSQIPKKCGYVLVIMMMLAMTMNLIAANNSSTTNSMQQQLTVTGTVTDEKGEPIPGVSIVIKGTTSGIISNIDGKFSITVPSENSVLVFSYLGYIEQEITVGSNRVLNVVLVEDTQQLEELVVVGYGTQKKATLTGSVVAVASKEIVTTKSQNMQNMLTGKLPGLRNIQKTGEPGEFTNQFDIRGMGSPLIIVDGVPRGEIPRMDSNDIESVSILKDASAAIYGVRGANGVVLITTKSGEKGKAKIEYSGYFGLQVPAELLHPVNARDRALIYNERTMRSTVAPTQFYDAAYFEGLIKGEIPDNDWYAAVIKDTAPQQQHNISVNGGTEKVNYFINLGYTNQGSFFATNSSNYNRYNMRSNVTAQITNRLKAGMRLNMMMDENNRQHESSSNIFKALWRMRPDEPLYANNTPPYYWHSDSDLNPLAAIDSDVAGRNSYKKNMFQSNMTLDYDVPYITGLTAQFLFSYDKTYDDNSTWRQEYYEYRYNPAINSYDTWTRFSPMQLTREYRNSYSTLWNARLNYDNTFAEQHHVGAVLVYEERYSQSYNYYARREFSIPVPYLFAGNATNQEGTGSGVDEYALRSVIGRLNYDYAGKYMTELSFRYDGNSKFPKGKQWGFFPSVLLGYRISEEAFIKDNIPSIQNLKIRGSWGQSGDESASNFEFIAGYDYPQVSHDRARLARGYVFGNTFVNALGFRNAPNLDLTWYTATMKNIGLDADMMNGLFGFSVDLFQRDRNGLMDTPSSVVPGTFGSGISRANLNADRTKGFEVEFRHRNKINDFQYNVTAFVQMARSMWTKKVQPYRNNSYNYWRYNAVDRYKDIWFGLNSNGQFQSYEEIANSIYAGGGTLPGDPIYEDWNGDGVIDAMDWYPIATTTSNDDNLPGDAMINARNYPLMNFALTLGGSWKWIDFNFLFQGAAMSYVGYTEQLVAPLAWNGNALEMFLDRWHTADPNKDPYDPTNIWISGHYPAGGGAFSQNSRFNIQNGAYMRLKSAEIGFTIPQKIVLEKVGIKNLRLFVNSYNLLTITGVKGLDPEKPSETYGYLYPLNRSFNFGGTITF